MSTGGAGAIVGMKTGVKIGSKIRKYPGNLTASAAENAGKVIKVMTMDFDPIASGTKETEEKIRNDNSKNGSNKNSQKQSNEGKKVTQKHSENTKTKETENSNSETFAESEMRREKNSKE